MKTLDAQNLIKEIQEEAFNRGFQAGLAAAKKAVNSISVPLQQDAPQRISPTMGPVKPVSVDNPFREGTDSAKVFDYIKNNPGHAGVEIIDALQLDPKLVRTALWRMKSKRLAVNQNGWRLLK